MLRNLVIRNYALIEYVSLEFGPGLTIITGETGAGKSIMLGALQLVMGGRADSRFIADGTSKSVVEAVFTDVDPNLRPLFEDKGIEWNVGEDGISEISIRRELTVSGRSRIFINDTSVTLQTLSVIGPRLIDIHSQHANAKINNPSERLAIIDALSDNNDVILEYKKMFGRYVELRRSLKSLREEKVNSVRNVEFIRFRLEQLEKLKPRKGELKEIENRFELLSDADEIKEKLHALASLLSDSDSGIQCLLNEAFALAAKLDPVLFRSHNIDELSSELSEKQIPARIKAMIVESKDIFETVDDLYAGIDTDPMELSKLSQRMNLYYETMKRFQTAEADELVDIYSDLKNQLANMESNDGYLPRLENEARKLASDLRLKAEELSVIRRQSADRFSIKLCEKARPLGLPNINFKAAVKSSRLTASGQDEVDFLCSFNKNGILKNVGDIASGGEISRMMLSMKSILAGHFNLPTIIFDEVDTGVSGEIADKMGLMMRDAANNMQVIAITHLPQVAARGDHHFKVFKTDAENRTVTHVEQLDSLGRVNELASMISGSQVTDAAIEAARQLLSESLGN